jgi:membrane protein
MTFRTLSTLVRAALRAADRDGVPRLGAALSFYTLFSLAPLLLIATGIVGAVFGQEAAHAELVAATRNAAGDAVASLVERVLDNMALSPRGVLATLFGVLAFLLGATAAFTSLQGALNTVWNVASPHRHPVWEFTRKRMLSFVLVLGTGLLGLLAFAASVGLSLAGERLSDAVPGLPILLHVLDVGWSFAVVTVLFAMIYKLLPDVDLAWRHVWSGAMITAAFFVAGKQVVGVILGRSVLASAYGAAGSLVVFLFWVYYSAQLILLGAEFTQAYVRHRGSRAMPAPPT